MKLQDFGSIRLWSLDFQAISKPTDELNDLDLISIEPSNLGNQTTKPLEKPEQPRETLTDLVQTLNKKSNWEMLDCDWEMFECDKCEKKYNHRSGLYNHIKAVHEGVKFPCNNCDYTSRQKNKVKIHRPFVCSRCLV